MRRIRLLLVVLLPVLLLVLPAQAQPVPRLVSYQGVLYSGGSPVTTATNVTFALFSDATCTTAFPASGAWSQTLSVTPDAAGVFSVLLGSTDPATPAYFGFAFDRLLYLKTSVGGMQVACQALAAAPYALGLYGMRVEPAADPTDEGPNVIGGWSGNSVGAGVVGATISGGGDPFDFGTSYPNQVTGDYGTVGGGQDNTASGEGATVGGGESNTAGGVYATVGGGRDNTASGSRTTVGGGNSNTASGIRATVGGGEFNTASDQYATVPGGRENQAGGDFSFAAGRRAKVRDAAAVGGGDFDGDQGTFVWADSENADFTSTGPDQVLIRAAGGVGIGTNAPTADLHVTANSSLTKPHLFLLETSTTGYARFRLRNDADTDYWDIAGGGADNAFLNFYKNGVGNLMTLRASGNVGIGTTNPNYTLDVRGTIGNNTTLHHSDRRWKEDIKTLEGAMGKVAQLRGVRYRWQRAAFPEMAFPEGAQIGLIAQEVEAVLPEVVREGADGYKSVAYANLVAVLVEALKEQQAIIDGQQAENERQQANIDGQQARIAALEAERGEVEGLRAEMAALRTLVEGAVRAEAGTDEVARPPRD